MFYLNKQCDVEMQSSVDGEAIFLCLKRKEKILRREIHSSRIPHCIYRILGTIKRTWNPFSEKLIVRLLANAVMYGSSSALLPLKYRVFFIR